MRIPDGERVARLALVIPVQSAPRVDVAVGLHHLDRAAGDVATAQPDHRAYPARHVRRIENFPRRKRVEISGKDMKRESTILTFELLLDSVEQAPQLAGAVSLGPLGKPRTEVEDEDARVAVRKRHLEQCMPRSRRMTPVVSEHGHIAEESSRVRRSRSEEPESRELRD